MRTLLLLIVSVTTMLGAEVSSSSFTVARPVIHLYSAPMRDADVVSQAILGASVTELERKDGWCKVRTADDYTGWVEEAGLVPGSYGLTGRVVKVTALFANLYREPSITKHQPVATAPWESKLEVVSDAGAGGRFLEVSLPDKRHAFVQAGDVGPVDGAIGVAASIELGRRFLGLPYLWGGASAYGYDCSGFTQMLMRNRGLGMPRDAHLQAAWSGVRPVDRSGLAPGDLLFFGSKEKKITHTGYYVGEGEFIHATAHGRPVVQISSMKDSYWASIFICARRAK